MKTYAEKRFFKWELDDVSVSLRAKSGSYGGGSEVLVVSYEEYSRHCWRESNVSAPLRVKEPYGGGEALIVEAKDESSKHGQWATAQHGDGRTGESSGLYARCPSNPYRGGVKAWAKTMKL